MKWNARNYLDSNFSFSFVVLFWKLIQGQQECSRNKIAKMIIILLNLCLTKDFVYLLDCLREVNVRGKCLDLQRQGQF